MLESPLRIVGRFPRPVRLLLVGTLVNKLGTFIVPYLTLVLLRDFHMREGEAARLLFAYGFGLGRLDPGRRRRHRPVRPAPHAAGEPLRLGRPRGGDGPRPLGRPLRPAPRRVRLHRRPLPARRLRDDRRPPALVRPRERLRRPAHGGEPRLGLGHRPRRRCSPTGTGGSSSSATASRRSPTASSSTSRSPRRGPTGLVRSRRRRPPRRRPRSRAAAARPVLRPRGRRTPCATASSSRRRSPGSSSR